MLKFMENYTGTNNKFLNWFLFCYTIFAIFCIISLLYFIIINTLK